MNILDLTEEQPKTFSEEVLDSATAKTLYDEHKKKISIEPNPWNRTYTLRSNGYVGYIPINERYTVKIQPKVDVNNVFKMLEYAYNLKSFELLKGITNIESTEDFFERFVNILARRILDRNRKGLYCDYVERSDVLPFLRGHTKIMPTTVAMLRGAFSPTCEFEEHTPDLPENQILLCVLDTKYKSPEKPDQDDISQIYIYSATMSTRMAFLIYPTNVRMPLDSTQQGIRVKSITFDINKDPDRAGFEFLKELLSYFNEISTF